MDEKSANEMVRRLILPRIRTDRDGSSDTRITYMRVHAICIDLGKTTFHLVAPDLADRCLCGRSSRRSNC
jgi:hypothetical protein